MLALILSFLHPYGCHPLLYQLVSCSLFIHVVVISGAIFIFFIVVEFKKFGYHTSSFGVERNGGA